MSKLTLNISKAEFENRLVNVLEKAVGSTLTKKRSSILNDAMVTLLHGKREDGKHEHNLDQFWSNEQTQSTSANTWVVTENYFHEDGYDNDSSTFTAESEEAAKRQLFSTVCSYIAENIPYVVEMAILLEQLSESGSDYGLRFLEETDMTAAECAESDVAEFLLYACNEDLETHEVVFDYLVNLICIEGSHTITEIEAPVEVKSEPVTQEPSFITIHTIIETHKAESEDGDSDDVSVSSTINEKKHDSELLCLFRKHVDEESALSFDDLIDNNITQEVIADMDADEDEIRKKSYDDVVEWLCENGRPNMLIEIIPDATYGMVSIEVRYEQEAL
ncbi:hypothetical protein [Vibrio sp. D431a]|uniref:hypothetical protein n=1 Tax=Vibrio sp. D431a TaxID=2837388 RepID=UPI00255342AB|nr:hypothetical protein [Vibrio sp. D431a]MDK9793736.1 hypothetical protein [Vibrio sp. D431a]